jgi:small ligand-binding sensory domain FIST
VAVAQGCRPLSEPLLVTRAHDNLILEIEGRPALDVLKQRAPTDVADSPGWLFGRLVVGLIPGTEGHAARPGEYVTRNLVAVDPDTGVLAISDVVEEGQSVLFALREARASRDGLERVVERCRAERARCDWRFGLYFNCLARGRALYGRDDVDAEILAAGFPGLPILGFGCAAEIAPLRGANQVFTYSGVLVLVGE